MAGCTASDPCDGRSGTCISLTVTGSLANLQRLNLTVDQPTVETRQTPGDSIHLPVTMGLNFPASVTGLVNVGVAAVSNGAVVAVGAVPVTVSQHRGRGMVTLESEGQDGSVMDQSSPPGAPSAPTNVSATGGDGQATVSWSAPSSSGTSAISSYIVVSAPGGIVVTTTGSTTMATITGLTNGTAYAFSVAAVNAAGTGPAAQSNAVTPSGTPLVPSAPTNVMAIADVDHGATVSWTAPSSSGSAPITSYTVTSSPDDVTLTTPDGNTTSIQVKGLTPQTQYTFTVYATNSVGNSPASQSVNSVVVLAKLAAPTGVTACGANAQIKVAFGGVANAQSYDVYYNSSGSATSGNKLNVSGSPAVVPVSSGSYKVAVTAVNALGDGAASTEVTALADSQIHDTLFVVGSTRWGAYDCFTQIPDGTSAPTRSISAAVSAPLTVDAVNAVVWLTGGTGIVGYADATRVNGTTSASYTIAVPSTLYAITVDPAHHKFYELTACAGACGNPTYPLLRFNFNTPSDLSTASSEAALTTPGDASQLFTVATTGDIWASFGSGAAEGSVGLYPAAYNLADGSALSKSFTFSAGSSDHPGGVAYAAAAGGTLYAGWTQGAANETFYVTGIDGTPGGQLNPTGTVTTSSAGQLAIGNAMLLVQSSTTAIQAWSLPTPGSNPMKTVTYPEAISGLFYVP